ARLHLAEERYPEAIEAARTALRSSAVSGRYVLEAHAVIAGSQLRSGHFAAAKDAFRAAINRARQTGQRRGLVLMQQYAFTALAGGDEATLALWPDYAVPAESDGQVEDDMPMVTLTVREAQVLHALEEHAGPVGLAHVLGLSGHSVKTHIPSGYRERDVSHRH